MIFLGPILLVHTLLVSASGTVAVMPFKNLNADPDLDWLRAGIAETMISDLKKTGSTVVERAQIDSALAELALQKQAGTEESTVAKAGKLVGASRVVVGSFQHTAQQMRITARFIRVETGTVDETAIATGPLGDIFGLQDQIVAHLLGTYSNPPDPAHPLPRPVARRIRPGTLKAYRSYALAMTDSSDVNRVQLLHQALRDDPDFSYAADALGALEKRLRGYHDAHAVGQQDRIEAVRATFEDDSTAPAIRSQKAAEYIGLLAAARRSNEIKRVSAQILQLKLPPLGSFDLQDFAAYWAFRSRYDLRQESETLRAGEDYERQFPSGVYFTSVEPLLNHLIENIRTRKKLSSTVEGILAGMGEGFEPDYRRCDRLFQLNLYAHAVHECEGFIEKWKEPRSNLNSQLQDNFLRSAASNALRANAETGHFTKARELVKQMIRADPERTRTRHLDVLLTVWPVDG